MEAGIEDDFENFLHWVKSGNQHPQDFCFEDSFKPGAVYFSFDVLMSLYVSVSTKVFKIRKKAKHYQFQ